MITPEQRQEALGHASDYFKEINHTQFLLFAVLNAFRSQCRETRSMEKKAPHYGVDMNDEMNYTFSGADVSLKFPEFKRLIANNSDEQGHIALLFLVWIYTLWEEKYRPAIEKALGVEQDKKVRNTLKIRGIQSDALGDLRKIRVAVVHNSNLKIEEMEDMEIIRVFDDIRRGDKLLCDGEGFKKVCGLIKDRLTLSINKYQCEK